MSSPLDAPLRAVAKTLGDTFGKTGVITYESTGEYNPTTGVAPTGDDGTATVKGPVEMYSQHEIDGTFVRRGDVKWTVPAKSIAEPRVNDSVDLESESFTVQSVTPIYSGELVALYELQLRR